MKRRSFIVALIVSLLGSSVFFFIRWFQSSNKSRGLAQPRFLSMLCDQSTIRMLGRAYLELKPTEINGDVLLNGLLPGKSHKIFLKTQDLFMAESQIEKKIKQDFDNDNIVVVQGWVLSITEARQCAIFSMINS